MHTIRCAHLLLCCLAVIRPAGAAEPAPGGKHLFILSGQSNMREPLPSTFLQVVGRALGKDKVIVVTHAQPSQSIRRWYKKWSPPPGVVEQIKPGREPPPSGDIYDELLARVNKALQGKPPTTVTFIWMQGEADAESGWGAVYEESFYGVLGQLKVDLGTENIHYVLGRINDYWLPSNRIPDGDLVRGVQRKIGEAHPYGAWVDTDDLNRGLNPWNVYMLCDGHFPPAAYKVLGERFARKACGLINPQLPLGEEEFRPGFFDTSDDVAGHAAIGDHVRGSAPAKGDVSALTDGRFGPPDPRDDAWVAFTPADGGDTELVLDLGEAEALDQLGVNLLYHPDAKALFPTGMTFATSEDGETFHQVGRDIRFTYGRHTNPGDVDSQSLLALAPGPLINGLPVRARFIRIRITAPKVMIDEILVNPMAVKTPSSMPDATTSTPRQQP